jgi:hypothetical protein
MNGNYAQSKVTSPRQTGRQTDRQTDAEQNKTEFYVKENINLRIWRIKER